MSDVFLDTVGLIATWDTWDQWHVAAGTAYRCILRRNAAAGRHGSLH
jgi:hypothetical protein